MRPARRLLWLLLAVTLVGALAALAAVFDWPRQEALRLLFWIAFGGVALLAGIGLMRLHRRLNRDIPTTYPPV